MLTKIVNGKQVVCDDKEEASIRAEWAKNDPALKPQETPIPTIDDLNIRLKTVEAKLAALGAK